MNIPKTNRRQVVDILNRMSNETLTHENATFTKQVSNSLEVLHNLKSSMEHRSQEYVEFLEAEVNNVHDLIETKIKDEASTGRTPKRKTIRPDDVFELVKTRPHNQLLEAFRARNTQAAASLNQNANPIEGLDEFKSVIIIFINLVFVIDSMG